MSEDETRHPRFFFFLSSIECCRGFLAMGWDWGERVVRQQGGSAFRRVSLLYLGLPFATFKPTSKKALHRNI